MITRIIMYISHYSHNEQIDNTAEYILRKHNKSKKNNKTRKLTEHHQFLWQDQYQNEL